MYFRDDNRKKRLLSMLLISLSHMIMDVYEFMGVISGKIWNCKQPVKSMIV